MFTLPQRFARKCVGRALVAAFGLAASSGAVHAAPVVFDYTGALATYTVTTTGTYDLLALGAQGGSSGSGFAGGLGAKVTGGFSLTAGDQLRIAVGGLGITGSPAVGGYGGGGGGGSFIYNLTTSSLLMAAGGGGGGYTGAVGGAGLGSFGVNGFGGTGSAFGGGGGGGFSTDGAANPYGGKAFLNGAAGGQTIWGGGRNGGFGGGGASGGYGAGGGGGFDGGNAGVSGGGGNSFCSGLSCLGTSGFRSGNGQVVLELTSVPPPPAVPEPASLALVGAALAAALSVRRRRLDVGADDTCPDEASLDDSSGAAASAAPR